MGILSAKIKKHTGGGISVLPFLILTLFVSCEQAPTWDEPVREYFEYYTETAEIGSYDIVQPYLVDRDGNICLSSDGDKDLTLYARNPKKYTILSSWAANEPGTGSVTITQDSDDPTVFHLKFSQAFLLNHERGGDIGGTITQTETVSQRVFEKESYRLNMRCNSAPPEITDAAVMSMTDSDGSQTYVLAFMRPGRALCQSNLPLGIHHDIVSITINGETLPVSISDAGVMSFPEDRFTTTRPESLAAINRKFEHSSQSVYFLSGEPITDGTKSYTIGFTDEAGLSTSTTVDTQVPRICAPVVKNNDGNVISAGASLGIHTNPGESGSTVTIEVPTMDETDSPVADVSLFWELYQVDEETAVETKIGPDDSDSPSTENVSVRIPTEGWYRLRTWARKGGYKDSAVLDYRINLEYATLNPPTVKNLEGSLLSLDPANNLLEFDSGKNYATVKISPPTSASDGTSVSGATIKYKINRGTEILSDTVEQSGTSEVSLNSATLGQWFLTVKASKTGYNDSEEKSYRIKVFSSDIWVKSAGNGGNDTTGDGSSAAPFATVQKAVSEFASYNKSSGDYKIHVSGTVTGNQTISNALNGKASKLTLIGESSGTLDGNGSGTVLNVTSSVPVTIKSLAIKNGNAIQGGGINIASSATVTLDSGTVMESNQATNYGGAIYNGGTLNMTGSVNLYTASNSEKYNDVYLPSGKYINIVDSLSATTAATVTPYQWKRGTQVLSGNATTTNCGKFKVSADGWSVVLHDSKGKVDAPLYVKNDGNDSTKKGGTSSDAYKTISKAASECWDSTKGYTINIVGEVKGTQEIPSTVTTAKAKSITLTGASTPVLNGNGSGPVLKVSTTVPVTITSLKITGGKTDYGAGLCVNSGTVKLGNGVVITGNEASYYGGGVHVVRGAKLFVYGSALIGDGTTTAASSGNNANSATIGGGGISNYGALYLGYSDESTPVALTGGVKHNYATWGGGIRTGENATVLIKSGSISYNGCANGGGGICLSSGSVTITGGTIEGNHAVGGGEGGGGGGILFNQNATSLDLQGGTFTSNSTGSIGGAINAQKTFSMSGAVSITCSAQKNNDIYLSADSSNSPSVKIDDDFSGTGSFWISGSSSVYAESYYALTGSKVSSYFCKFRVFKSGTQDWTILTSGKMAKAKLITASNAASFTPVSGQVYNFVLDENMSSDDVKAFLKQICDKTVTTNQIGASSTLDLSRLNVTDIDPTLLIPNTDNRLEQKFQTVILPPNISQANMESWCLHKILGAKNIVVPAESTSWCSVDGVVYNKAKTKLIWYPPENLSTNWTIPTGVTSIGKNAVSYTKYLQGITIPTSVTYIGNDAFYEGSLVSITVPSSVTHIGDEAFCYCSELRTVTLPNTLSSWGIRLFQSCSRLTTINIPSSVTTIGGDMFRWCSSLSSITIPSSVTSIGTEAFAGTALTSVSIPSSVTSLGHGVFADCNNLTSLSFGVTSGWTAYAYNGPSTGYSTTGTSVSAGSLTANNFKSSSGSYYSSKLER